MNEDRVLVSIALIAAVLALIGCGGESVPLRSGGPVQAVPEGSGSNFSPLPPPSALHGASYAQQDLFRWGSEYDSELPQGNVSRSGHEAVFAPHWIKPGGQLADLAYATYRFSLSGFDLDPVLRFTWTETGSFTDAWVALADFPSDRWEWFQLSRSGILVFDPTRHISVSGDTYAVVMLMGTAEWRLERLRIGPQYASPQAVVSASPRFGSPPLAVSFDASASFDPDGGNLTRFEWDWEGDGTYDLDSGADATVDHTYNGYRDYRAVVRVTDDENALGTGSVAVYASGPGDWYMFGHDPQHTRRSPFMGPATNALKWAYRKGATDVVSLAIGADGTVYVGSTTSSTPSTPTAA